MIQLSVGKSLSSGKLEILGEGEMEDLSNLYMNKIMEHNSISA
jgi:hypothetical protein